MEELRRAGWGIWLEGCEWVSEIWGLSSGKVMLSRIENCGERERGRGREGLMIEIYFSVIYCCD